jgi:hypothetical protein
MRGRSFARTWSAAVVVTVPAVSLLLPNYNSVPLGETASIEGGAFMARANDSSAGFFNPAGLAHAERSSISGGAGAYQFGSVTADAFLNVESSVQQIPALFGVVINDLAGRPMPASTRGCSAAAWVTSARRDSGLVLPLMASTRPCRDARWSPTSWSRPPA